jgi:hypothetical protein
VQVPDKPAAPVIGPTGRLKGFTGSVKPECYPQVT